jgi:hypothetical protein
VLIQEIQELLPVAMLIDSQQGGKAVVIRIGSTDRAAVMPIESAIIELPMVSQDSQHNQDKAVTMPTPITATDQIIALVIDPIIEPVMEQAIEAEIQGIIIPQGIISQETVSSNRVRRDRPNQDPQM